MGKENRSPSEENTGRNKSEQSPHNFVKQKTIQMKEINIYEESGSFLQSEEEKGLNFIAIYKQ